MSSIFPSDIKLPGLSVHTDMSVAARRGRSNSLLKVENLRSSNDEALDQDAYTNFNAEWVNRKGALRLFLHHVETGAHHASGAWSIHIVLIVLGKIVIDTVPGITQNISWTVVNLLYNAVRTCSAPN